MTAPETLIPRVSRRNHREYATADGDLVIAYQQAPGAWLVTAHSNDLGAQVQGMVEFNDAGFRGRQWESAIDGQQHASLMDAMREAVAMARRQADVAAFGAMREAVAIANPERRYGCTVCPWTGDDPDAAQAHVDYLTTHPRGWMGLAEEHPVTDRQASYTYERPLPGHVA